MQFGTTYYYKVSASNSGGSSAFSSPVAASTYSGMPLGLNVAAATVFASWSGAGSDVDWSDTANWGGAAANGPQSVSVSWNTVSGVTSYTLDRATSSGGPWTQVYSGAAAKYTDVGLQPCTTYYYEVRSQTSTGNSAFSSPLPATTCCNNLAFGGSAGLSNENDLAVDTPLGNVTFNAGAGAFTLDGAAVYLAGGVTNNSTSKQTIALGVTLIGASQSITAAAGDVAISGNIGESGGQYGIDIIGPGTVTLSGSNSYSGGTVVSSGKLVVSSSSALPSGSALSVGANANLVFGADVVAAPSVAPATSAESGCPGGDRVPARAQAGLARRLLEGAVWGA